MAEWMGAATTAAVAASSTVVRHRHTQAPHSGRKYTRCAWAVLNIYGLSVAATAEKGRKVLGNNWVTHIWLWTAEYMLRAVAHLAAFGLCVCVCVCVFVYLHNIITSFSILTHGVHTSYGTTLPSWKPRTLDRKEDLSELVNWRRVNEKLAQTTCTAAEFHPEERDAISHVRVRDARRRGVTRYIHYQRENHGIKLKRKGPSASWRSKTEQHSVGRAHNKDLQQQLLEHH